jgi:anti-sigma B factor antagonist
MGLQIREREREGITILDLEGRITAGESEILRQRIKELTAGRPANIILNLKDVEYIDSTGLGALVICYTSLRKAEGKLKLLNLSKRHIELLVMTKLATIFEIFGDEQDAVNSFFPDREIKRFDILAFVQEQTDPQS